MCWSWEISTGAALCHLLLLLIMKIEKLSRWEYDVFLILFASMEIVLALLHIFLHNYLWNTILTVIAYILIYLQPVAYTLFSRNKTLIRLSIITLICALISLGVGFLSTPNYSLPNTNYGLCTHTTLDENGHHVWSFALKTIQYHPTHYVYLLLIGSAIAEIETELFYTLGLGWLSTLFLTLIWIGLTPSLPAVWCLTSVCVCIPIMIRTYQLKQRKIE